MFLSSTLIKGVHKIYRVIEQGPILWHEPQSHWSALSLEVIATAPSSPVMIFSLPSCDSHSSLKPFNDSAPGLSLEVVYSFP